MFVSVNRDDPVGAGNAAMSRRVIMPAGVDAGSVSLGNIGHQTLDERFRAISMQRNQVTALRRAEANSRQAQARQSSLAAHRTNAPTPAPTPVKKSSRAAAEAKPKPKAKKPSVKERLGQPNKGGAQTGKQGAKQNPTPVHARLSFPGQRLAGRVQGNAAGMQTVILPDGTPALFSMGSALQAAGQGVFPAGVAIPVPGSVSTAQKGLRRGAGGRGVALRGKAGVGAQVFGLGAKGSGRNVKGVGRGAKRGGASGRGSGRGKAKVSQDQLDDDLDSYMQQGHS